MAKTPKQYFIPKADMGNTQAYAYSSIKDLLIDRGFDSGATVVGVYEFVGLKQINFESSTTLTDYKPASKKKATKKK